MQTLRIFYLAGCPYCRNARKAMEELRAGDPAAAAVAVEWVEETERPELANKYDYYRVPSVFCGTEKLYECDPGDGYDAIKENFSRALAAAGGARGR